MVHPVRMLGKGAYAKVYNHGHDAVKMSKVTDEDDLVAVAREHHVLRMGFPNTVPYLNCFYNWDTMNLKMEMADSNLNQWYRKQTKISTSKVRDLVCQMLRAVHAMHEHGVTHRDLKPDNVLLKGDKVWLCDFGLSRQFSDEYGIPTGYMVTRWYRAPEIWKKEKYTNKVDIWSVGCILHKLFYGKVPGKTLKEIEARIPEMPNEVELHELMHGLLTLNPENRWSAKEALDFLEEEVPVYEQAKPVYKWTESPSRYIWFQHFYKAFPSEHRILANALMLYDMHGSREKDMCCAMALSIMIFKTRGGKMLSFVMDRLKELVNDRLMCVCRFMVNMRDEQTLSIWESFEGTFEEYLQKVIPNPKKRKL
mgnify:CR=1 FL=1|jgi:serine/threonine protein kinase